MQQHPHRRQGRAQLPQEGVPFRQHFRRLGQLLANGGKLAPDRAPRRRSARLAKAAGDFLLTQLDGITHARKQRRVDDRPLVEVEQGAAQRDQVAGEVARIDSGDVGGRQRPQRLRVVPVVKVPSIALHSQERLERGFETGDELGRRHVAEIAGDERRQQLQTDVRGRGAMGDSLAAVLLHVVRDQPVVGGADELVEEPPRLPRDAMQDLLFIQVWWRVPVCDRSAGRVSHQWRDEPQRQNGQGHRQTSRCVPPRPRARARTPRPARAPSGE